MATTSSGINGSGVSFQGVTSGLQTDALVNAALQQASGTLNTMQAQVTAANSRTTALTTIQGEMENLGSALDTLNNGFDARTVASSDPDNTYVTAKAEGGAAGTYDIQVSTIATNARLSSTLDGSGNPTNLAASSATAAIFSGASADFAVQGTDGVTKTISLTAGNNNIYGLANAINALGTADPNVPNSKGLGVLATVVNVGSGTNPYRLVLTSRDTGILSGGANFTIADTTAGGAVNNLGIAAGTVSADGSAIASGGTGSNQAATNATFTLDGIQLTRASNNVTDAVDGVTFQLKKGGQTGTTALTVTQDNDTATTDMQAVVSAFNTMLSTYKSDSVSGGPLYGDSGSRAMIDSIRAALVGGPAGLSITSQYNSAASMGLSTNKDGTLSLDATAFKKALNTDPEAAKKVFATTGVSSNAAVSLSVAGSKVASGSYSFNITSYVTGGDIAGTVTGPDGTQYSLTGTNGTLVGATGTPLEGLYLGVTGTGTGTLSISKGVGQLTQDVIDGLTAYGTGTIAQVLKGITDSNKNLNQQILGQQSMLATMKTSLEKKYSDMEALITQLQSTAGSLGSLS
jgi:flagellar hook-associated protein 2